MQKSLPKVIGQKIARVAKKAFYALFLTTLSGCYYNIQTERVLFYPPNSTIKQNRLTTEGSGKSPMNDREWLIRDVEHNVRCKDYVLYVQDSKVDSARFIYREYKINGNTLLYADSVTVTPRTNVDSLLTAINKKIITSDSLERVQ